LRFARAARNEALYELAGQATLDLAFELDFRTMNAISLERRLLGRGAAVDLETYVDVSTGKQLVGLPGTFALVRALGWDDAAVEEARTALLSIALGLQFQDDVVDWEEDAVQGGAWAVLLARGSFDALEWQRLAGSGTVDELRSAVLSSGVLAKMLKLSAERFVRARGAANELGASELAEWLDAQATHAVALWNDERESPGRVLRRRKLVPWAAEVLA
jgi:hypothetical protein